MTRCLTLALLACLLAAWPAGAQTFSIRFAHAERNVHVLAPRATPRGALPLLILLHGRFGTGEQILRQAGISPGAGLVVAAPDGHQRSWASGRGVTSADRAGIDDVAFLRQVVAEITGRHHVDPARIFVAGMSNGGFMAARLACDAADLVAGIAIVGATTGEGIAASCQPARPVSVLMIHGTQDPLVGADGTAPRAVGRIMGARDAARFWAMRAGCAAAAPPRALPHPGPPDGTSAWRTDYAPCRGSARVAFIEVRGGGHVWPGRDNRLPERIVGPSTRAVDASAEILAFFGLPRN
jgi:polyhydroxybutyrate depolymerase